MVYNTLPLNAVGLKKNIVDVDKELMAKNSRIFIKELLAELDYLLVTRI